jgi:hypothetical protein
MERGIYKGKSVEEDQQVFDGLLMPGKITSTLSTEAANGITPRFDGGVIY